MVERILTAESTAELLRCSATAVREGLISGTLPGLKIGSDWIVPEGALMQRLNELALDEAAARRKPALPGAVLARTSRPLAPARGRWAADQ